MAYDELSDRHSPAKAAREYLRILELAARENETGVDDCLRCLQGDGKRISADRVEERFRSGQQDAKTTDIAIDDICLDGYDQLLDGMEVSV